MAKVQIKSEKLTPFGGITKRHKHDSDRGGGKPRFKGSKLPVQGG